MKGLSVFGIPPVSYIRSLTLALLHVGGGAAGEEQAHEHDWTERRHGHGWSDATTAATTTQKIFTREDHSADE